MVTGEPQRFASSHERRNNRFFRLLLISIFYLTQHIEKILLFSIPMMKRN